MFCFETATPESVGISTESINRFISRLSRNQVPIHSILLMRHEKLVLETYAAPITRDTLHRCFSISKSFTSIAIGLLAAEGKLSLDDKIISYFPDKLPDRVHPFLADMSIRDMLMMRTCHAATTYKLMKGDPGETRSDWVASFFTVAPTHPAGTVFHYDTSSAHTLCALVERLTQMPMLDYLREKCLYALSFSAESYLLTDPLGISMGGTGLMATSLDLLKFGYLILHGGLVNGKQLVPADYIHAATSFQSSTVMTAPCRSEACGYGYQFWRTEQYGYVCYGMGGQLILFQPELDLILVTTADTQGIGGGNQMIYDALYEELYPELYETCDSLPAPFRSDLPINAILALSPLTLSTVTGQSFRQALRVIPSAVYHFAAVGDLASENLTSCFSDFSLTLDTDTCTGVLHFTLKQVPFALPFGYGHLLTGRFPIYNMLCATSGALLADGTFYIKSHILDRSIGSIRFQLAFRADTLTVFMRKQEENLFHEFDGHFYGCCKPLETPPFVAASQVSDC